MAECVWCGEKRGLFEGFKWLECPHCGGAYHVSCCSRLVVGDANTRYCASCWKPIELPETPGESPALAVRRVASDWVRRRISRRPPQS